MPYNRRRHIGKWGVETTTLNGVPIIVPRQPYDKQSFTMWSRMLKSARMVATLKLGLRWGYALPIRPAPSANPLEKKEFLRWERAAYLKAFPPRIRRRPRIGHLTRAQVSVVHDRPTEFELTLVSLRAQGLSIPEIADRTGKAEATVRRRLISAESRTGPYLMLQFSRLTSSIKNRTAKRAAGW